tara:strand:- start:162 stop:698 length:537 start_codon:yes stop_codon:yes gene_type:complete
MIKTLSGLEKEAYDSGLVMRIQVRRPLNLWTFKLVVAEYLSPKKVRILGEMKAWAYPKIKGFQLDTMRVNPKASVSVGHLIWAGTMTWALEVTPCTQARLLAICDDDKEHIKLVRYFRRRGFHITKKVGSAPIDLPLRVIWGGAGSLMTAKCKEVLNKSYKLWSLSKTKKINYQSDSA